MPTFESYKKALLKSKMLLIRSNTAANEMLIWNFVNSIKLNPVERQVIVEFNSNPFGFLFSNSKTLDNKKEGAFAPSIKLVAGVRIERVWKFESKIRRTSSDDVISAILKKQVFSRNFMEKTLGLTTGQAYWYIRDFLKNGIIRKLKKTENVGLTGKEQALYKYIKK